MIQDSRFKNYLQGGQQLASYIIVAPGLPRLISIKVTQPLENTKNHQK